MPGFIRIAHRGAPRRALENTLESFRLARKAGARFFELDVWLSKDGVPMVCHDRCLGRVAGKKVRISSLTRSQIQAIPLPRGNGQSIPTLGQVLEELEGPHHTVYIEMKDPSSRVVPACLDTAHGMKGRWVLSSFVLSHLHLAHALYPKVRTQALVDRLFMKRLHALPGNEIALSDALATYDLLTRVRHLQKPVFVYTVNTPQREDELMRQGVAGVFTDTW